MTEPSAPFLLEFFGVPGSGKSTISHRVVEALTARENCSVSEPTYAINSRPSLSQPIAKLPYIGYGAIHEWKLVRWYATQADPVALSPSLLLNWLFVRGVVEWSLFRSRATALDQGLIQALWSFQLSESADTVSFFRRRLLEVYPRTSSLVVCVEVSPQTARARLDGRIDNQSRVGPGRKASFEVSEAWEIHQSTKEVVRELINSRPGAAMLTLRNDAQTDLTANVESVVAEVKTRFRSS
jgi:thymidylate kinase